MSESQLDAETLRNSLRFQIGDGIVGALSTQKSGMGKLRSLMAAALRARMLVNAAKIRNAIFSGLPSDGLPPVQELDLKAARTALQHLQKLGKEPVDAQQAPAVSDRWVAAALSLANEMQTAIVSGYPLPAHLPQKKTETARIFYVSRHDPAVTQNGYARRTMEIVQGLARSGHNVTVGVTGSASAAQERFNSIRYVGVGPEESIAGLHGYVDALSARIEESVREARANIIHAASNYLVGLAALYAGRRLGLPVVYEVRGLWEETRRSVDPIFGQSLGYRFQSAMEVFCAMQADAAIIGSDGIGIELVRRGANPEKLVLAQSGAPQWPTLNDGAENPWRKIFPPNTHVLGFVGSLTTYEGIETIASALAILNKSERRYCLLLAGGGPFAAGAEQLIRKAGVHDDVCFAGNLAFSDVQTVYAAIDLLVYPRDSTHATRIVESLKAVEGLAAGVPAIISDLPPSLTLRQNCPSAISVRPGDPAALAAEIDRFFALPASKRKELGEAGRKWVFENRSWAQSVETIRQVYARIGA